MAAKTKGKQESKSNTALGHGVGKILGGKPDAQPAPVAQPSEPLSADVSTVVTAAPVVERTQAVQIDLTKHISSVEAQVDTLLLIDSLDPTRKALADAVKIALLKDGARFADGKEAVGKLNLSNPGSEIDPTKLLAALLSKNEVIRAQNLLQKTSVPEIDLAKLVSIEAVSFDKKALASIFTGDEIKAVSVETKAKAPSLSIEAKPGQPPLPVLTVLERLTGAHLKQPKLFVEPEEKAKKA